MPTLSRNRPRLLLLSMYALDRGSWGPTVRIANMRRELSGIADLDMIAGTRGQRRLAELRYAFAGRLRRLDGIYVETSSFLPAETDVGFLALAKGLGIPVLTYIRDAYQLFPEYYPLDSLRRRFGRAAFGPTMTALGAVSTCLAFPTDGLAAAVQGEDARPHVVLPPGSPPPVEATRARGARQLLFVGDARLPVHGADRLVAAVGLARKRGAAVELTVVARPGQEPPGRHPSWLHLVRAEGTGIHDLLPNIMATVIPRPRTPYNDIALAIKLFDYLSYGRPVLATDCTEQARIIREADAGIVVGDSVEALADGVARLAAASPEQVDAWSTHAHEAAVRQSWASRARQVVDVLGALRG